MRKKIGIICLFFMLFLATMLPAMGENDPESTLMPLQSDNDWDYTTNPPHMYSVPSGNVGIGTANPERKFHIAGSSSGPNPIVYIQQVGTGRGLWVNTSNGTCGIVTEAGNQGLRVITAGGNGVLIQEAELSGVVVEQVDDYGFHVLDAGKDGIRVEHADGWAGYFNGSTCFNGTSFFNDSIGIKTDNPDGLLEINGDLTSPVVTISNQGDGEGIVIDTPLATGLWINHAKHNGIKLTDIDGHGIYLVRTIGNAIYINNSTQNGVYIASADQNGIHVNQANGWAAFLNGDTYISQNLGIGTTTPAYPLDVHGPDDVVARFAGRVQGQEAINHTEYVTLGQVRKMVTGIFYTPESTQDTSGEVGDITYDDNYMYIKTDNGWKRSALETWSSSTQEVKQ